MARRLMDGLSEYVERYGDNIVGKTNKDVYEDYLGFCQEMDFMQMEFRTFMIHLCTKYLYQTKQKCTRAGMVQFIEPREPDRAVSEYLEGRTIEELEGVPTEVCYKGYLAVCGRLGLSAVNRVHFSRKVCEMMGITTKSAYGGKDEGYRRVFTVKL